MQNWFNLNKRNPYVTPSDLLDISQKTKLVKKTILSWIANKRNGKRKTETSKRYFTLEDEIILRDFFKCKNHPGPNDLADLAKLTRKEEKRIRQWFNQKRADNKD